MKTFLGFTLVTAFLAAWTTSSCTRIQKNSSESAPLTNNQNVQALRQALLDKRDRLVTGLRRAVSDFEKTGQREFTFIPSLENCRLGARFLITIRNHPGTRKKTIEASFANGRVLTRQLSFDLDPDGPVPIAIRYKISSLNADHIVPIVTQGGFTAEPPGVDIKRIYGDFATFFRGKSPEEYIMTQENPDSFSGYLNWLYALGDFNEYLIALMDYQKTGAPIAQR